jgi:hypothetical protein
VQFNSREAHTMAKSTMLVIVGIVCGCIFIFRHLR